MTDHSELKRLAEAFPADLDWDSNTEPFFNGPSGESLGGGATGFYSVYGEPFRLEGEDCDYDGLTYVEVCTADFAKFMVAAREGVLSLIAETKHLAELLEYASKSETPSPQKNDACCGCVPSDHAGPCAEQSTPRPAQQMPDKESICRAVVDICDRIPGSTAWNAAEFAYDEMVARLSGSEAVSEALEITLPYADDAFEYRHGGTTYFDGTGYREACITAIESAGLKVKP